MSLISSTFNVTSCSYEGSFCWLFDGVPIVLKRSAPLKAEVSFLLNEAGDGDGIGLVYRSYTDASVL